MSLEDTLGPRAPCEVLDPREVDDAKKIAMQVYKLYDNNAFKRNQSLSLGLVASVRHAESFLQGSRDACDFGERVFAAQCKKPRKVLSVGSNDTNESRLIALQHLKGCMMRCGLYAPMYQYIQQRHNTPH